MCKIFFQIIFLLSAISCYSFNYDFIKFNSEFDNRQFEYIARQDDYLILVSKDFLSIYKSNQKFYEIKLNSINKIEPTNTNNYSIYLYFKDIKEQALQTFQSLFLKNINGKIITKINLIDNQIEIQIENKTRYIKLCTNLDIKKNSSKVINEFPLSWSTIFGGTNDEAFSSIAVDKNSNVYAAGYTLSSITNDLLPIKFTRGQADIVLTKFNLKGVIQWIALVGSTGNEYCMNIALDSLNNIWLAGETYAGDYYTCGNAMQTTSGGSGDGIITKFNSKGDILLSTYFGGSSYDSFVDICSDRFNNIWLTGRTMSSNYPTTSNGYHTNLSEFYESPIVKINNNGSLLYSGLFGGNSDGALTLADCIVSDKNNNIIIAGYSNSLTLPTTNNSYQQSNQGSYDSFITKFDNNSNFQWCTYIGGNQSDYGSCLTVDNDDNLILNSYTISSNLPIVNSNLQLMFGGAIDNYLSKFNSDGQIIWANYFGGNQKEGENYNALVKIGGNIKVNNNNDIFFYFRTNSNNLKTRNDELFPDYIGGYDGFILRIDKNSKYISSTYFGGSGDDFPSDIEIVNDSSFIICGGTSSTDFPLLKSYKLTRDFSHTDGFIAYFGLGESQPQPDTTLPFISYTESEPCNLWKKYFISDTSEVNAGMAVNYQVNKQINCIFNITTLNGQLIVMVNLLNSSQQGEFSITVFNKCGKSLIIEDILNPSGSNFIFSFEPKDFLNFGSIEFSGKSIRILKIINHSNEVKVLNNLHLYHNLDFNIPQSQLPIVIQPFDTAEVTICFSPTRPGIGLHKDTLEFIQPCFKQNIVLNGEITPSEFSLSTNCDVDLIAKTDTLTKNYQQSFNLNYSINYIDGRINITFENKVSYFNLEIANILGQIVMNKKIEISTKEISIDCSQMPTGFYFINISDGNFFGFRKILIQK